MVCKNLGDRVDEEVVFAVTGGTKLMAFGALQAALEKGRGCVYVDTLHNRFVTIGDKPVKAFDGESLPSLTVKDFLQISASRFFQTTYRMR